MVAKNENPILSLVINIVIPVVILHKGAHYLGPHGALWSLLIALSFPLVYGIRDYVRTKNKNYVSIIGVVNACLTGGLALYQFEGSWFAFKDASLPYCLGLYVLISSYTEKPFAKAFFMNPQILKLDLLQKSLDEKGKNEEFERLLRHGTRFFSLSFFISGTLNFFLALRIFEKIDPGLSAEQRGQVLNDQIAHMTAMSMAIITVPLIAFTTLFLFWFFRRLTALTGLKVDDLTAT
jgi:hypothetical protein